MHIILKKETDWVEEGNQPRRLMTLDEFIDQLCWICLSKDYFFETHVEFAHDEEEFLPICAECLASLINDLAPRIIHPNPNPAFVSNIRIYPI